MWQCLACTILHRVETFAIECGIYSTMLHHCWTVAYPRRGIRGPNTPFTRTWSSGFVLRRNIIFKKGVSLLVQEFEGPDPNHLSGLPSQIPSHCKSPECASAMELEQNCFSFIVPSFSHPLIVSSATSYSKYCTECCIIWPRLITQRRRKSGLVTLLLSVLWLCVIFR